MSCNWDIVRFFAEEIARKRRMRYKRKRTPYRNENTENDGGNDTSNERESVLRLLHYGAWTEELLSAHLFGFVFDRILTKQQRFVTEEMVTLQQKDGYQKEDEAIAEIAIANEWAVDTVRRECDRIKRKYRNCIEVDVKRALNLDDGRRKGKNHRTGDPEES